MRIARLTERFGAEIVGLDLARELDEETRVALRAAALEHRLLVLRDQRLTAPQLAAFGRVWGELDREAPHPSLPELPEVTPISNDAAYGHVDVGNYWHADGVFQERKVRYSILHAVKVASSGGDTLFCDAHAAHDALPSALRERLAGRRAFHMNLGLVPLIARHPETGRSSLYINLGGMLGVRGISLHDASVLRDELDRYVASDAFVYRHRYRAGDVLVHDAFSVLHRATAPPTELRLNHRVTVLVPPGFEVAAG